MRRAALVLLALLAGAAAQAGVPEPQGFRQDDYRAPVPDTVAGGRVIHTEALKALLRKGKALLVDVLPAPRRPEGMRPDQPWMPVPRRDIPGSLWLPDVGRGTLTPTVEQWFQDRLSQATQGNKARPLVFYCLSQCWMSWNAAKRAAQYGYSRVYWYPDGSDGWEKAGQPLAEARPEPPPAESQ
jgi:PQQ-dependent catabolism-associated CXXCW motif protein